MTNSELPMSLGSPLTDWTFVATLAGIAILVGINVYIELKARQRERDNERQEAIAAFQRVSGIARADRQRSARARSLALFHDNEKHLTKLDK